MNTQEVIEQVSLQLTDTVADTLRQLGPDITQALLIHLLHEVSLGNLPTGLRDPAA